MRYDGCNAIDRFLDSLYNIYMQGKPNIIGMQTVLNLDLKIEMNSFIIISARRIISQLNGLTLEDELDGAINEKSL